MTPLIMLDSESQALYNEVTQVPDDVKALLPPLTDSITVFLTWSLPDIIASPSTTLPDAESSIMDESVCWTPDLLLKSPIPPHSGIRAPWIYTFRSGG